MTIMSSSLGLTTSESLSHLSVSLGLEADGQLKSNLWSVDIQLVAECVIMSQQTLDRALIDKHSLLRAGLVHSHGDKLC